MTSTRPSAATARRKGRRRKAPQGQKKSDQRHDPAKDRKDPAAAGAKDQPGQQDAKKGQQLGMDLQPKAQLGADHRRAPLPGRTTRRICPAGTKPMAQ